MTYDVFPLIPGPQSPSNPIFIKLNWFILNYDKYGHRTMSNFNSDDGIIINSLFVPSARTSNYGLMSKGINGPRIWNVLPTYLKNESSFIVFLKNLKLYYLKL